MTRTVNGEHLFGQREKEILRKMLWQIADFSGVEVLTYCILSNHFHVLLRVPDSGPISDRELLRRYRVLYPKPTKYQTASINLMERELRRNGEQAGEIRRKLLVRMGDISEFMKTLKQRFSIWFNSKHNRFGTLWAERFKSILVEWRGNALQTMAAYIDLNPVRAGIVEDPKDYRFCGYAEAVAGASPAKLGIRYIWLAYADGSPRRQLSMASALRQHRALIFGKRSADPGLTERSRKQALRVLEQEDAVLPKASVLRCRVRYFSEGAILGSREFVESFAEYWQVDKRRKSRPKPCPLRGADWQGLAVLPSLKTRVFG